MEDLGIFSEMFSEIFWARGSGLLGGSGNILRNILDSHSCGAKRNNSTEERSDESLAVRCKRPPPHRIMFEV